MRPAPDRSPDEDPQITEARLQLLAQLRLGPKRPPSPPPPLPRIDARDTLEAVEDLRPAS